MRIRCLLILAALVVASPALADCADQRLVFQPANDKLGFSMEIMLGEAGAKALVHRPFRSAPDRYDVVVEGASDTGSRYVLVGPAGILRFDVAANGTAVVEANREIPSRWRLACQ